MTLNLLSELEGRRIAVLGDMLELGPYERQGHEMVGARASQIADILITIGPRAHIIAQAARKSGMDKKLIQEEEELEPVIEWLQKNLTDKDAVLIKGSHGLHLDEIVSTLEKQV
jgi:UDP-N-acetylmuramoyl-tripeptide--D-alanyl-D-alanine ligase